MDQAQLNGAEAPATDRTPDPAARRMPRKLSVTDKLVEMRASATLALDKLRQRELALAAQLSHVRAKRVGAEAELERIDTVLVPGPGLTHLTRAADADDVQPYSTHVVDDEERI